MNQEHYDLLIQGPVPLMWNAWRERHPDVRPDLSGANLIRRKLRGVNLSSTNLISAELRGADLNKADLSSANLHSTDLSSANLISANLSSANLISAKLNGAQLNFANLIDADLSFADLSSAHLGYAILRSTHFNQTTFSDTVFAEVDLNLTKKLETAKHNGRSVVDINTVLFPHDKPTRLHFLRGVGFTDTFIDYLPSLLISQPIQYHSLFLSHSHHDQAFTKQLHNDLQNQGVRCWLASHDLRPGTPIVRGIEEAIYMHEKLLLILSMNAIVSNWVQQEVETALYKETTTRKEMLFPIRLDNTILENDTLWARRLRQRHIGDFTNWQDETTYNQAFATLLSHLKVAKTSIISLNGGASISGNPPLLPCGHKSQRPNARFCPVCGVAIPV